MSRRRKPGRKSSAWIRPGKRWRIYARDGYRCVWCGERPVVFTLDHLFPTHSRFRDNHPRRLVTACWGCNTARKQTGVAAWLRTLRSSLFADAAGALERLRRARNTPLPAVAEPPHPEVWPAQEWDETTWEDLEQASRERMLAGGSIW